MEDMNVDLLFHHGVKQVLVKGPSGNLFLVQDSDGIGILQELLTEAFRVVHVFDVDDNEEIVYAPNIINHSETYHVQCEYGTDAESESDDGLVDPTSDGEYDFDELELIKMQKNKEVNANLSHYKDLFLNMTFKNLDDARKTCPGYKLKTFKQEHNCEEALHNPRATTNTLSHYFKSKVQNNPKDALKDMKQDLMDNFNLNTNDSKLKRAKRMALQKMQGSFLDEYNRLEAYANEIRMTNPGSDVVINLSKDAMLLEKLLNLKNGDSITFMYDMQKGLLNVVENVLPLSNHRYCVRHVEANWMKRFRTREMKKLMWWAVWCTYEEDFKDQLNALGALSEEAAKDLVKSWQLTGIPCPHAIKALRYKNIEP
ncbi:hypothetical protein KY284_036488 [Solanum tuberosum]|nr:hypothetical protein KY284_036488 [Solanum tuberosum]